MATRTRVMLSCDMCGNAKDVQTRVFGLDGKTYEIDLCPKDGEGLSKVEARYRSKARKVTAKHTPRHNGYRPRSSAETAANGDRRRVPRMKVPGRGRVLGSIKEGAETHGSGQQAAKLSSAKAKAAGSRDETRASRSGPPRAEAASKRAAKPTHVGRSKGIYVYGVLPADIEVAADMPGIGEGSGLLRVVRSNGLAALISELSLSRRLGSPDDLRTHREILDATATEVPVLPLPFGTVLASEGAVAEDVLEAHHEEFACALDQLESHAEFLVKGRYVEKAVLDEVMSEGRTVTAKREQDTRTLKQAMEELCVASVVRQPTHELEAMTVAFLVAAAKESEMERVIEDLARAWEGRIEVQLSGPMAAYDFAGTAKLEG